MEQLFRNKGFAMIELMISLGIVAVTIVAFETLIVQAAKISRANQSELQANLYLIEVIETAKAIEQSGGWSTLFCASNCFFDPNTREIKDGEETLGLNNISYVRSFSVDESINTYTKKIVATINWNNGDRSLVLEDYVYEQ